jgi:protein ImuB
MLFACIYVPDFPVEAVMRVEKQYREHPVAVLAGKPPLVRVFAANQKAQELGIEVGMTKLHAEAFPGIILRRRSQLEESSAHSALLDCARSFSPRVEDTACDTIILDIAGLERLFGIPQRIACDLARRASDLGLQANVAVAGNPDAAMHAAYGFPGVTVIPAGQEAERLGNLPLDVLFCSQPFLISEKSLRSGAKNSGAKKAE